MKPRLALVTTTLLCFLAMSAAAQDSQGSFNRGGNAPIHSVMDFTEGFDTASFNRETDTPQHPLGLTVTTATLNGQTAGALHVRIPALTDWDVLRSPEYAAAPTTTDDAKTVLWARGDARTSTLMFEWDERNGTRWIATFPVTEQWQRVVLSPKDFAPWLVAEDLARSGFHPSRAVRFRMGLDFGNTHTAQGPHEYWVAQIGIESPPPAVTPAASLVSLPALSADAVTIPLRPVDTGVTCQVRDRLQIAGSVTMQNTFDTCLLLADGVVASTRTPSIPTDNYSFIWTPKTPGTHTLELRYTTLHAKVTVRRLLVTAGDSPPAVLVGSSVNAGVDTPVSVVGAGASPFPLARVDFYFNNKPLTVATSAPFSAILPIEAITQPGTYPVKFVAYDGSGRPFYAHASKIEVPQRVQVTAPRTFTLRTAGDKANLTASVLPGIKVAKVSYSIVHADASHYETLADVTAAPYSADVDLSNRASGDYWVRAIATSAAGNSYEAWAVQLTLTNMPDDKRVVQEAKDRAKAEAEQKAQLGYQITDLGTLPGDSESIAIGINDKGQVVGQSITFTNAHNTPQGHAFLWQRGEIIDIGTLTGFSSSSALSINDGGKIVGLADNFASIEDMHDASGTYLTPVTHAFLWDDSRLNDLDILAGRTAVMANCINNNDEIVGYLGIPHPKPFALVYHPFVWRRGQMTDLGVIGHYEMNYGLEHKNPEGRRLDIDYCERYQ